MDWDWKNALRKVAPMLGTALGGPFGGLAGTVLGAALGVDDPTDEKALEQACKKALADPNLVLKFKQAELDFKVKMKELDIKEKDLVFEDRKSARDMQKTTRSKIPGLLAVLITMGFFGLLLYMMVYDVPKENEAVLHIMLGALATAWTTIVAFYFGSSDGSQAKNILFEGKKH